MLYKNAGWMANRPNQINQVPKPQYTDRLAWGPFLTSPLAPRGELHS
jgi:hypothetical protein